MDFNEQVLALPISELELSVRSVNCLKSAGYLTVGQVVTAFEDDNGRALLDLPHFGRKSYNELREVFGAMAGSRQREIMRWVSNHGEEIQAIIDGYAAVVPTFRGMVVGIRGYE